MLKISIPTPCHEDWNKMTPDETGPHCSVCVKSVVDFTNMSDDEVKYFFLTKKEDERVCGRFKQTQLHRIIIELPQNIFSIRMPLWKKFLAACLVVFSTTLFSCETKIKGKAETETMESGFNDVAGLIDMPMDTTTIPVPTPPPPDVTVGVLFCSPIVKGDINIVNAPPTSSITDIVRVPQQKNELIIVGDTIYEEQPVKQKPDSLIKTKNPPKADPINCNSIKNYY
jgi:hypothetical protein